MITYLTFSDNGLKLAAQGQGAQNPEAVTAELKAVLKSSDCIVVPNADYETKRKAAMLAALLDYDFCPDASLENSLFGAKLSREVYNNLRLLTRPIGKGVVITSAKDLGSTNETADASDVNVNNVGSASDAGGTSDAGGRERRGAKGNTQRLELHPSVLDFFLPEPATDSAPKATDDRLSKAKLVFLAGRGVGNKTTYDRLEALARLCGAEMACTRPVAMNNWASYDKFVGISGKSLNCDLVVAFGVSGSGPLMQGLKNAKQIVAVNTDENALIFDFADCKIVGDLNTVISEMEREYR